MYNLPLEVIEELTNFVNNTYSEENTTDLTRNPPLVELKAKDLRLYTLVTSLLQCNYFEPGSTLPVDFHKFYIIVRDWVTDLTWRDLVISELDIEYRWVYNDRIANYPTLSFSSEVFEILQVLYEYLPTDYIELNRLLSFASSIDLASIRKSKRWKSLIRNKFEKKVDTDFTYDSLGIDNTDILNLFKNGDLVVNTNSTYKSKTGRVYFLLQPKRLLVSMLASDHYQTYRLKNFCLLRYNRAVLEQKYTEND